MKIERHSPSSLNLFCASPAMFVLEKVLGIRQPMGVPAHRGTAVEEGLSLGLFDPKASLEACTSVAYKKYDAITALSSDARREEYRASIPAMVKLAVDELRPYGVPSKAQGFVQTQVEGLRYPIVGYYDFYWE